QSRAISMAQTKLAEIAAGAIPIDENQTDLALDEDPSFSWSMQVDTPSFPAVASMSGNLDSVFKSVTITISHKTVDGRWEDCCSLTQLILDPTHRANTSDPKDVAANSTINSSSSTSSGSGSSSS